MMELQLSTAHTGNDAIENNFNSKFKSLNPYLNSGVSPRAHRLDRGIEETEKPSRIKKLKYIGKTVGLSIAGSMLWVPGVFVGAARSVKNRKIQVFQTAAKVSSAPYKKHCSHLVKEKNIPELEHIKLDFRQSLSGHKSNCLRQTDAQNRFEKKKPEKMISKLEDNLKGGDIIYFPVSVTRFKSGHFAIVLREDSDVFRNNSEEPKKGFVLVSMYANDKDTAKTGLYEELFSTRESSFRKSMGPRVEIYRIKNMEKREELLKTIRTMMLDPEKKNEEPFEDKNLLNCSDYDSINGSGNEPIGQSEKAHAMQFLIDASIDNHGLCESFKELLQTGKDNYDKNLLPDIENSEGFQPTERYCMYLDDMKSKFRERDFKFGMAKARLSKNVFQLPKESKNGNADNANGMMCSQFVAEVLDQAFDIFNVETAALYPWRLNNILASVSKTPE